MKHAFARLLSIAVWVAICLTAYPAAAVSTAPGGPYVWISDSMVVQSADARMLDSLVTRLASSPKEKTPFVKVDSTPMVLAKEHPVYPKKGLSRKLEVDLWVEALVGVDGKVQMARIIKGDISEKTANIGFEKSALTAAMQTTYRPAQQGGRPVAAWITYKVSFRLQ